MSSVISIIIPFLNEAENIRTLTDKLDNYCRANQSSSFEIIFVDDGSSDDSVSLLKNSKIESATTKIIKLSKNFGSHAALRAGILHATGDYITFMYADLQDPLELIGNLHQKCLNGNEIVWATRSETQAGLVERLFSSGYAAMMRKFAVPAFPAKGFDIVMFGKKTQLNLNQNIEANSSIFLQILTLGFKQDTIFYVKDQRKFGKSKWTLSKKIKLFIDSFIAFSFAPIRLVTIIGTILFICGSLFSVYLVLRKLMFNDLEQGWAALISILMIGFGITNISLGIIAEYLWRTLDASRKRPVFVIDEIIDLKK
ncbi:MAG TPA: glycosyltransferase [Cyclobacteriaceae bacterium]